MVRKVLTTLFLFPLLTYGQPSTPANSLSKVEWLVGTWVRQNVKEGSSAFERWEKSSAQELTGRGVSLRGADTVFVEKLQILEKDRTLFYVADVPENANPVLFKFTLLEQSHFVCENPAHDFPKKIEYSWDGEKLIARISGDGRSMDFIFVKQ